MRFFREITTRNKVVIDILVAGLGAFLLMAMIFSVGCQTDDYEPCEERTFSCDTDVLGDILVYCFKGELEHITYCAGACTEIDDPKRFDNEAHCE